MTEREAIDLDFTEKYLVKILSGVYIGYVGFMNKDAFCSCLGSEDTCFKVEVIIGTMILEPAKYSYKDIEVIR